MKTNNQQSVEKQIPGKFPTNLKNYLRIAHTEVYAVLLEKRGSWKEDQSGNGVGKGAEKECERKAGSLKASHQLTLAKSLKSWQTYEKSSQRHTEITKNLGVFVGSSYIVENLEFVTSWPHLTIVTPLLVGHCLSKKRRKFWLSWKPGLALAHIGAYIRKVVDEVLGESEIYSSKVLASLTDNGSNMVTVFCVQLHAIFFFFFL